MEAALIFMSVLTPGLCFLTFLGGFRIGREVLLEEPEQKQRKLRKSKDRQETEVQRVSRLRHENIENYGTKKPQREVK